MEGALLTRLDRKTFLGGSRVGRTRVSESVSESEGVSEVRTLLVSESVSESEVLALSVSESVSESEVLTFSLSDSVHTSFSIKPSCFTHVLSSSRAA